MSRIVEVTQEDIANGDPIGMRECALALAIKRAEKADDVLVKSSYPCVEIIKGKKTEFLWLPPILRIFVSRCERGMPVKPFQFDLDYVVWCNENNIRLRGKNQSVRAWKREVKKHESESDR